MTAAAPVCPSTSSALARETMSPEAITGTSTRSTSSAVSEWSAVPVYICFAERGWSVSAAAPASTSRGPTESASREPFATPRRIFTVTGTETASATLATIRQACSGSSRSVAPAPGLGHLADGAAEVDVDDVGARGLDEARRIGHRVGVCAEDLHGQRMLVSADPQVSERALVAVREAGAADHLGAHQTGSETASLAAKGLHADPRHRGEHDPAVNHDRADAPGCVQIYLHSGRKS